MRTPAGERNSLLSYATYKLLAMRKKLLALCLPVLTCIYTNAQIEVARLSTKDFSAMGKHPQYNCRYCRWDHSCL